MHHTSFGIPQWVNGAPLLDSTRLVFIDETAANTKMTRLNGRCLCGGA
jgi:hypothetical protein